ncbi:hypothetical protein Patl1_25884 [Pistacia atlantica]|uniref:Uncharacterized protein n=1 Tax=Pistacia atlantica TaxID=434234 RepID=A0ACC1B137_9ROSI|nr:hypothetical protein Patl1_25884 [Pistacia atlantica]
MEPPVIRPYVFGESNMDAVDFELSFHDHILKELNENLGRAQQCMVSQADKCQRPVEFEVGQQWVCKVAYKLAFPEGSKIHPVFHVSLLKPCSAALTVAPLQLPPLVYRDQPHITPLAMLGRRIVSHEGVDVPQLLVQWHGLPLEGTSWEDGTTFEAIYEKLSHNLEDKVEVE